jgi:hypothetical protein
MKFDPKRRRKCLVVGGILLAAATPSFALLGVGDIVFDPTSYASLVSQATTALNQFKTIENNVTHFSLKQQWQTTLNALKNANVANMFGETAGFSVALNTNSPSASTLAWKTAHLPPGSDGRQQPTTLRTRHGRDVRLGIARLPHGNRTVPGSTRPERKRKQRAVSATVRLHLRHE